jgi:predicted ester cyclase
VIKATWNGPFEGVDCTGQRIEFTGLSMYQFRSGKIARARDCWDFTVMIRKFGVLPQDLRSLR